MWEWAQEWTRPRQSRFDDVNRRFDDLSDGVNRCFDQMRADHVRFDERLRAVEFAFGKVDQRLLTIERATR